MTVTMTEDGTTKEVPVEILDPPEPQPAEEKTTSRIKIRRSTAATLVVLGVLNLGILGAWVQDDSDAPVGVISQVGSVANP